MIGGELLAFEQRAQMIALLTEIRDALMLPIEEPRCPHPDAARLDMSSMGEIEWKCRACGHHEGPRRRT